MGKCRFGLRAFILNPNFIYIYIYIYIVISKILSIAFIIIILLLSHINAALWSSLVLLNISESFSKYEEYEYTNVFVREITHLF